MFIFHNARFIALLVHSEVTKESITLSDHNVPVYKLNISTLCLRIIRMFSPF